MSSAEQHDTSSDTDTQRLPANVKLLGLTSLVNDIASEMIYPLLPDLLRGIMAASYEQVALAIGVIEGIAEAISSILKLFAGGWSDRTGRRKSWIVSGYSIAAFARPLLGLAVLPWQVLACRVGDRLGKGIRSTRPRCGDRRKHAPLHSAVGPLAFIERWITWVPRSDRCWPRSFCGAGPIICRLCSC